MSQTDVVYSCGECGYDLNLSSAKRKSLLTISEYRDYVKKDLISFESIDLTRFIRVDKMPWLPFYLGRNGAKTKLKCRQCHALIGYGYKEGHAQCFFNARVGPYPSYNKIMIKSSAIQPQDVEGGEAARDENSSH